MKVSTSWTYLNHIRRGDPVWSPVRQYDFESAQRATTRGRPYEFQIHFPKENTFIVHCTLSIVY